MGFVGGELYEGVPAYPEGWYHLAMSADLPAGAVIPRRVCGRDVVAFRTAAGALGVLDAHCPHLGAHLGHGGRVVGEALRCPFHALHWGVDGRCVGADDVRTPGMRATARSWPVRELHGALMVYYSARGEPPWWEIPDPGMAGWSELRSHTLRFPGHVLEVTENGVDRRHFIAVHGYSDVTDFEVTVDGPVMHSRFGFTKEGIAQRFDTLVYGLGYAITDLTLEQLKIHARVILLSNQVDAETVDFTVCATVEGGLSWIDRMLEAIVEDVRKDLPIWAHKRRLARPALIAGDGPIGVYRKFARQFYPPAAPGAAEDPGAAAHG
jgi:nitrite reductase/ring-hydroxylating ferredoxin subunit